MLWNEREKTVKQSSEHDYTLAVNHRFRRESEAKKIGSEIKNHRTLQGEKISLLSGDSTSSRSMALCLILFFLFSSIVWENVDKSFSEIGVGFVRVLVFFISFELKRE